MEVISESIVWTMMDSSQIPMVDTYVGDFRSWGRDEVKSRVAVCRAQSRARVVNVCKVYTGTVFLCSVAIVFV